MYESPITIHKLPTYEGFGRALEDGILEAIMEVGIDVNKEELLKALAYDRDQYSKGYEDGRKDATIHAKWEINCDGYYPYCSRCGTEPENRVMSKHCPECGAIMDKED